jgi:hypothetical protein
VLTPYCKKEVLIKKTIEIMGKFLNDFKQFAMRGNVLDMAVGVIIGGAFGHLRLRNLAMRRNS